MWHFHTLQILECELVKKTQQTGTPNVGCHLKSIFRHSSCSNLSVNIFKVSFCAFSITVKYWSESDLEKLTSQYSLQMQINVIQTKFSR